MASIESKIFSSILRMIDKKNMLKKQLAAGKFNLFSCPQPPKSILRTCHVDKTQINGRNIFRLTPKNRKNGKHILYLHGGAYVQNFVRVHWQFLEHLVRHSGCTVTAPDYPLAPDFTYRESFAMVIPLYQQLLSVVPSEDLILMGDSAGGGFALALAQKMKMEHVQQPAQIILLSPWLDITLSNTQIKQMDSIDPFLGIEGLRTAGRMYAGGTSPDYYLLSPINGPLEGLGRISLFIGATEILVPDARKLKALLEDRGIALNYYEYDDMVHVWMLLNFPESKNARKQIVNLVTGASQ